MDNAVNMLGLHQLDWIAVTIYLLVITLVGLATKRTIQTREDFFMAGRRFGKLLMIFHSFGAGTHTDQAVAVTGSCYRNGISGIWVQWQWMFTTPFYWLLAPVFRRSRCLTTADMYRDRFSQPVSILFVIVSAISMTLNIGIMLQGTGIVISSMTGGAISQTAAILIMTFSFIVYGTAGGLVAAVVTDLIQGIFIILLSFLMIPYALWEVGGLDGIRAQTSSTSLDLISSDGITFWVIALLSLNAMVGIVAQSQVMATTSAGKTEWEGRVGMTYGNFLKRICTLGWAMIGVCALVLYPDLGARESEQAFGLAVSDLLPIGIRGIMLASIMAAAMSTCDALMVATSALFTENVYRIHISPNQSDQHYLRIGRWTSFVIVVIALFFSSVFSTVLEGAFAFFQLTASIGLSFWMGILWKRMNNTGVFVSFLVAAVTLFLAKFHIFTSAEYGTATAIALQTACFIPAGVIAGITASLLTSPIDAQRVNRFFVKIHTPIGQEDKLELPIDQAIPANQRLFDMFGFFLIKPNKESVVGFLVACAIVFILLLGTHFLLNL